MPETLFKTIDYTLNHLLADIEHGDIALPELQRPFVWKPVKVRDLFDSMYRGFPVGYLLFWSNFQARGAKQIGTHERQTDVPLRLIVDGQQRLTSLYAVLRGRPILDQRFKEHRIRIAFHPPSQRFEVADATHRRNPEWIADISTLWRDGESSFSVVRAYLERQRATRDVDSAEESQLAQAIDRLYDLQNYPFTALEISHAVDEEEVGEIFVRVNSKGVRLQQSDFILTLLSVFWEQGRRTLESFCRDACELSTEGEASAFNRIYRPQPAHLLRTLIALALKRAALRRVYGILRGRDAETGEFSASAREAQFQRLQEAMPAVINLINWHEFLKCIAAAGYRSEDAIISKNALVFAHALFLIGRKDFGLTIDKLRPLIARWFYAASVTARLSGSFESDMEAFLAQVSEAPDADAFRSCIEQDISLMLTNDFWTLMLPQRLATSAARSPALYAF